VKKAIALLFFMWYTIIMRIFIKRLFAFPPIFFLIFSFLSCCCFLGHAEAGISRQVAEKSQVPSPHSNSHCDSGDSQDDHSAPNDQCECPKLQGVLVQGSDAFKTADIALSSFSHQIILDKIFLVFVLDSHSLLAGPSPQSLVSSVPLYIKNPTLRI